MYAWLRLHLLAFLRGWVQWIDPPAPLAPITAILRTIPQDALFYRAVTLVIEAETTWVSGEARRHQVFARLLKEFPQATKRDVAWAIEAALIGR